MMDPTTLLPGVKASGRCPPLLIRDDAIVEGGVFEMALLRSLNMVHGLFLSTSPNAVENFTSATKMASGGSDSRILEQRRCILLAVIGSTSETMSDNATLKSLLNTGLLVTIKGWLDDVLAGKVGGVDLLLHLLNNIIPIPVTKELVTNSKLGKTVSSVEKHIICAASANESAIKKRIQDLKERWSASVKAMKSNGNGSTKRQLEHDAPLSLAAAKKSKQGGSALSSLLKKVENTNITVVSSTMSAAESMEQQSMKQQERATILKGANSMSKIEVSKENNDAKPKKGDRRIQWADNNGKLLAVTEDGQDLKSSETEKVPAKKRKSRWADSKKIEIQNEKELMMQARKTISLDTDKDDELDAMSMMAVWRPPQLLPDNGINPPVQVVSNELTLQATRMSTTPAVKYLSDNDVPISPHLLSEVEKALELTLHNSVIPNVFPFFTPQAVIDPVANFTTHNVAPAYSQPPSYPQPYGMSTSTEADVQTVLGLGLPFFLVGFNVIALQALAANPSLLASFKDVNGVYKQPELINLVQTLTQNLAPHAAIQPTAMTGYAAFNSVPTYMQQQPTLPSFSQPQPLLQQQPGPGMRGYRGDQNIGDANLYLSGYGPTTTNDDIRAMFAPYVHVTEIVNKSGFSFVNTNDPEGATRAKEALNGSLLGGLPCRINSAKRKERDPTFGLTGASSAIPSVGTTVSTIGFGQVDVSHIKDDRGNPATKNLFVAGYGPGTTEQQLKDCFGQYVSVVSIVLKNTFAFVNTVDKEAAVLARSSLLGQLLNGGPLRINFAKESGRLGTSFDLGYHGPAGASASAYGPGRY